MSAFLQLLIMIHDSFFITIIIIIISVEPRTTVLFSWGSSGGESSHSLVPKVVRELLGLSRLVLMHRLVAGEGLHHADVSTQWHGPFDSEILIPEGSDRNVRTRPCKL